MSQPATSSAPHSVTLIPGDGVGPDITAATRQVLEALGAPLTFSEYRGPYRDDATGQLPAALDEQIRRQPLVLKGTTTLDDDHAAFTGLLRDTYDLYANVRPAWGVLPENRFGELDLVLIRENTEGLYVGLEHYIPLGDDPHAVGEATGVITREGCRRIANFAFAYAARQQRKRVTVVHKANILKALTGLFLETVMESAQPYKTQYTIEDRIVDACAMQLVLNPTRFDMLVTTNMFGDILADQLAGMVGGRPLAPGAIIGDTVAVFEPIHEAHPELAGKDVANPTGMMLAAVMLLQHIDEQALASRLLAAVRAALKEPAERTPDLGGDASLTAFTASVIGNL
ncbi:MAG: isocitrate/isopropylmalate dehydrogenase family protein [Gammaproteobacteria bacterium]|nr:isocitrate/isopropylmalate dehydrogenase family protein [Gammaproteobacteria bacterium]